MSNFFKADMFSGDQQLSVAGDKTGSPQLEVIQLLKVMIFQDVIYKYLNNHSFSENSLKQFSVVLCKSETYYFEQTWGLFM